MPNTPPRNEHEDWPNVYEHAERVRAARNWTKHRLYEATEISEPVYNGMKDGRPIVRSDKLGSFRAALGWSRDQLDTLLAGGTVDPPTLEETPEVVTLFRRRLDDADVDRARLHDQLGDLAVQVTSLRAELAALLESNVVTAESMARLARQLDALSEQVARGSRESRGGDAP